MFYDRLVAVCATRGKTVTAAVREAGGQIGSIAGWKAGRSPRSDTVAALADCLHTSTDYLLGRSDDPAPLDAGAPIRVSEAEKALVLALRAAPNDLSKAVYATAMAALRL